MPFGDPAFDGATYVSLLQRTYGFFRTWESSALQNSDCQLASLVLSRSRLEAISRDLAYFNQAPDPERMPIEYLPQLQDAATLLGSMYVVEGSTLGGQLIARMLESKLSLSNSSGYSFFVGAGAETGRRWKVFSEYLTAWSESHPSKDDSIIAAARKTFDAYKSWVGTRERMEKVSR
jgi:heme oxygenase